MHAPPGAVAEPGDVRRKTDAAEVVAKVRLRARPWEAGLLALFRQRAHPPPSRGLSGSPLEKEEAAQRSEADRRRRDPDPSSRWVSLSF